MLPRRYTYLHNARMFSWDDLRPFLAVARSGSTLAASRLLRVSQPTVVRRIAALEAELGLALFERRPSGYTLTRAGSELLPPAEQMEQAAVRFADIAATQERGVSGAVRISVYEIYAVTLLAPMLRDLHHAHPEIRVDLDVSDAVRDIQRGEADIALRSAVKLSGADLLCRRVAEERWALYCSRSYAAANGVPRSTDELNGHTIIGEGAEDFWPEYERWRQQANIRNTVDLHHGSATALMAAVRSGFGIALLPCLVADHDPELVCCLEGPLTGHSLWLVADQRSRQKPRVRVVVDFLAKSLSAFVRRTRRQSLQTTDRAQSAD